MTLKYKHKLDYVKHWEREACHAIQGSVHLLGYASSNPSNFYMAIVP